MPYPRLTKCMPDESRCNPFHLLHKALRFGQCRMLSDLGAQDFGDDEAAGALLLRLVRQLDLFRAVAEVRHETLLAALAARAAKPSAGLFQDHASHLAALCELQSLVRAVNVAAPQRRRLAGRSVYRCFALYVAADMARMDEEETTLLATLHQSFSDAELREIEGQCFAALEPEDFQRLMRLMLPALATVELQELLPVLELAMEPCYFDSAIAPVIRPLLGSGSPAAA